MSGRVERCRSAGTLSAESGTDSPEDVQHVGMFDALFYDRLPDAGETFSNSNGPLNKG